MHVVVPLQRRHDWDEVKAFSKAVAELAAIPGLTPEQADVRVRHGYANLETLVQSEESDLAELPELAASAAAILQAARDEAARRSIKVGDTSVAG